VPRRSEMGLQKRQLLLVRGSMFGSRSKPLRQSSQTPSERCSLQVLKVNIGVETNRTELNRIAQYSDLNSVHFAVVVFEFEFDSDSKSDSYSIQTEYLVFGKYSFIRNTVSPKIFTNIQ